MRNITPDQIAEIIHETIDETTNDLDLLFAVIQQITELFAATRPRDYTTAKTYNPLLYLYNQVYTNTMLLKDIKRQLDDCHAAKTSHDPSEKA